MPERKVCRKVALGSSFPQATPFPLKVDDVLSVDGPVRCMTGLRLPEEAGRNRNPHHMKRKVFPMNEKLIAGYAAYTNADEYGTDAVGQAPGSVETVGITIASFVASATTYDIKC